MGAKPLHTVPYGTGPDIARVQALRARLPSLSPFGTITHSPFRRVAHSAIGYWLLAIGYWLFPNRQPQQLRNVQRLSPCILLDLFATTESIRHHQSIRIGGAHGWQ
jgi:uncharacterized membrane protein YjdF